MPDDLAALMAARGAKPVTLRAPLHDPDTGAERMQRAAAWRLPPDHPDSQLIDRLFAKGKLTDRQYANACACMSLYMAAGLGRSRGVASYVRKDRERPAGEAYGPEDEWRALIRDGNYPMQIVAILLRDMPVAPDQLELAAAHLDTLDAVAARWDGERWREER